MEWGVKIMVTLHNLCHCSIKNPKLVRNDHFTLMTISGHKTTSVFRRYNVVTDAELQNGKWMNDEKIGVHMGFQSYWKSRDYWEFFEKKERTPFMGADFLFSSDAGFIFWIQISLGKLFSLINSWAYSGGLSHSKQDKSFC